MQAAICTLPDPAQSWWASPARFEHSFLETCNHLLILNQIMNEHPNKTWSGKRSIRIKNASRAAEPTELSSRATHGRVELRPRQCLVGPQACCARRQSPYGRRGPLLPPASRVLITASLFDRRPLAPSPLTDQSSHRRRGAKLHQTFFRLKNRPPPLFPAAALRVSPFCYYCRGN